MSIRVYKNADTLTVVNPAGLNFQSSGTDPDTQVLSISNDLQYTEPVAFTVAADEAWVDLSAASGTFNWNSPFELTVGCDLTAIVDPDGTYTAVITITTDFGDTEVPVTLVVAV